MTARSRDKSITKRSQPAPAPDSRRAIIGYALSLTNGPLGVQLYGSPKEILDNLQKRRLDLASLVDHRETEIEATEVLNASPQLSFSGGPHAETVVELLDSIQEADPRKAAAILARDPDAIRSADWGAGIPLLAAISAQCVEMVQLLLRSGARVDAAGQFGMTALHWAAALGAKGLVELLLDAGADARRTTWFLVTAGELGTLNSRDQVVHLITSRYGASSVVFSLDRVLERMRSAAHGLA